MSIKRCETYKIPKLIVHSIVLADLFNSTKCAIFPKKTIKQLIGVHSLIIKVAYR